MLSKEITELYEFKLYKPVFKEYIKENRLLSDSCVEELESIENIFFAYNLSIERIKEFESLFESEDYIILLSINAYNNSFIVRIYGKITAKAVASIREKIFSILSKENFDFHTYNFMKLYDNQEILACKMNVYSDRSTSLLLQKIKNKISKREFASKIVFDEVDALDLVKAIHSNEIIIELRQLIIFPDKDEVKLHINVYSHSKLSQKVQNELNRIMIDFLFAPEAVRITYVPNTTLNFQKREIIYSNNLISL